MRADDVWHYRKKSWMVPLEISFRLRTIGHDHLYTWPKTMKFLTFFVSDWNLLLLIPKPWLQPLFEVLLHFVFFFCPSKNLGSEIIKIIWSFNHGLFKMVLLMLFKHKSDDKVFNDDLQIANQVRHPLVSERYSLSFLTFSLRQPENLKKVLFEKKITQWAHYWKKKTRYVLIIYEQTQ